MKQKHEILGPDEEWIVVFSPWTHTPDGRKIYARNYGFKAFPIRLRRKRVDEE